MAAYTSRWKKQELLKIPLPHFQIYMTVNRTVRLSPSSEK